MANRAERREFARAGEKFQEHLALCIADWVATTGTPAPRRLPPGEKINEKDSL